MGGDEFVIFAILKSNEEALALRNILNKTYDNLTRIQQNHSTYLSQLELLNTAVILRIFLSSMDDSMYEAKNMHRLMH